MATVDAACSVAPTAAAPAPATPQCCLLLAAVTKRLNVGMLLRSAVAFAVDDVIIVGSGKVTTFGAQGTERFASVRHAKLRDAVAELKARGITICGIEITPGAAPVHTHPFRGPTAFLPGAEGDGLCAAHKALCDHFVYIPQYGNGTASLNVTVATSIVLHHFAVWAGKHELAREADKDKYAVVLPAMKHGAETERDLKLQEERRRAREAAAAGDADDGVYAADMPGDDDGEEYGNDAAGDDDGAS